MRGIALRLRDRRGRFPFQAWRVAPKVLQTVKSAFVAMENVDDHLQVIEHNPLTSREPVDRCRAQRVVLF